MIECLTEWAAIVQFNQRLIDQALALVDDCRLRPELDFGADCGPHLRHLLEHYEALLTAIAASPVTGPETGPATDVAAAVAYDRRHRDRAVETCPLRMRRRLETLRTAIAALGSEDPERPCTVELCGGLEGEQLWVTRSTLARELLFLASHTTHHYALIRSRLDQQGQVLGARFGMAPATVRHENARERAA